MARLSLLSRDEIDADREARDLVAGADDFALTMASKLDRKFWIRAERELVDGVIVVTDFAPGARPVGELAAGLAIVAHVLSPGGVRALGFRDIVPGGAQAPLYPARIVQGADLVKQLGAAVAERLVTAVASFEMKPRGGKIDARVTFAA